MNTKNSDHYFFRGGGEMGELIRAKDWSKTALGDPADWPQSLCTMVAVMLDNPFGMYIAWGSEYTQLYNDGYRPILGATKHPQALGISTRETFSEIWHIIESMFDGVMKGKAVGFPDLMLPLNRNGFVEECYFDFAYSPIRKDNGEVGGVLVTVIETTNKKKAQAALLENTTQLKFAIDAAELGAWDYNPATNKFTANNRLKTWFGLSASEEIELHHATAAIAEKDRERIIMAIKKALDYSSGGNYDEEYSIINPLTNEEIIVHGKGRAWFNEERIAYRFNGILQEVTENVLARKKIEDSEEQKAFLLKLSDTLVKQSNPDGIEEAVTKIALDFLEVDWCHFCTIEGDNLIIHRDAVRGTLPSVVGLYPISSYPLFKTILDDGHPFVVDNVQTTLILDAALKQLCVYLQNIAFINVPVIKNGKPVAMLSLVQSEPRNWTDAEVQLTIAIAERTWAAVERTEAEKALLKSEEKYRTLFNSIDQGFLLGELIRNNEGKGIDYYVHEVNSTYEKQTGINIELVLGKTVLQAFPTIDKWWIETYASVVDNQYPVRFEKFFEFTNRWFEIKASPAGKEMFTILFTDITERILAVEKIKESEERFRLSLAGSNQAVFSQDKNLKYTWIHNPHAEFKAADVVGKTDEDLLVPSSAAILTAIKQKILATGEAFNGDIEIEIAGQNVTYTMHLESIEDTGKNITGIIGTAMNISERIQAQQQIKESEQRFRLSLSGNNQLVFSQDRNLKHTWIHNPHVDFKAEDIIGKSDEELHVPSTAAILTGIKQKVLDSGTAFNGDIEIEVSGQKLFYTMHIEAIVDLDGRVTGIIGTAIDITERVKTQQQIKEAEELLRKKTDQLELSITAGKIGIWHWDVKNDILYWSNEQKAIYGFEPSAELLNIAQYRALVNPEDWERLNKDLQSAPMSEEQEYDFRIIRKNDGALRWIKSRARNILDEDGALQFVSGVNIDVTEQVIAFNKIQESEERFRALAQALPQLIWVTNEKGVSEFTSSRWKEYSGIEPGSVNEWKAIVHPDDYDAINAKWLHSLTTGEFYKFDVRLLSKNGDYRWHTVNGEPILDKDNKIVKWVGAFTDTHSEKTFVKELELQVGERTKELEASNTELQKMNKELQSFAYISSHDLQEPLRKIQTFATRISAKEENNLSDHGKDMFNRMQNAAERMQTLIQDLLAYSRTNTTEREFETTDLGEIIAEVKEDLKEELKEKQAIIEANQLCDADIIPFQFRQLMHNLISNALKFSNPHAAPYIRIKSEIASGIALDNQRLSPQNKYCHITVSDNGIGFEQQYSEKIFGVFQRLHGRNEYNGTGIGLAIVKKIVENHNGIITANGELNKGATFDIYIPST